MDTKKINNKVLDYRLDKLCLKNWKINNIVARLKGDTAEEILNNWKPPTKNFILDLLNVKEVTNSNGAIEYHDTEKGKTE